MAEPNATAIGGGLALGTVTLTGSILGMHYDALLIGFFAALVALLHMPPKEERQRTPLRVFSLVAGASFLAGVFAPATAQAAQAYLPWASALGADVLRISSAAVIGASANVALPLAFGWMARKARGEA